MENLITKQNHLQEGITTIILSVTFVSIFLGIFFFTYAKNVEKEIVMNNVNYLVNDLIGNLKDIIPPAGQTQLKQKMNEVKLPDMSKEDEQVETNNKALLKRAAGVLGLIGFIGIFSAYKLSKKYNLSFQTLVVKNLILLVGIAIVEIGFINLVAKQYISINPNQIKKAIIQSLFSKSEH